MRLSFFRNRVYDQASGRWTHNVTGTPCGTTGYIDTWNAYNRRGMLVHQLTNTLTDSTRYDGSGNLIYRRQVAGAIDGGWKRFNIDTLHNQLNASDRRLEAGLEMVSLIQAMGDFSCCAS